MKGCRGIEEGGEGRGGGRSKRPGSSSRRLLAKQHESGGTRKPYLCLEPVFLPTEHSLLCLGSSFNSPVKESQQRKKKKTTPPYAALQVLLHGGNEMTPSHPTCFTSVAGNLIHDWAFFL